MKKKKNYMIRVNLFLQLVFILFILIVLNMHLNHNMKKIKSMVWVNLKINVRNVEMK